MKKKVYLTTKDGKGRQVLATDEAAESSYGSLVVVVDGVAYGSGDLQRIGYAYIATADATLRERLQRAGYITKAPQAKRKYMDKTVTQIRVDVPKEMAAAFEAKLKEQGLTKASFVKQKIEEFLDGPS